MTGPDGGAEPVVLYRVDEHGVATVVLNRPARANAWIEEMEVAYFAALDRAVTDGEVRAIVVTGAGGRFCPGMDLDRITEITTGGRPYMSGRRPQTFLRSVPKPVVAAVAGPCAGIGFVQALMADVRFTTPTAVWSAAFSRIGLVAEDSVSWRLQRLCGDGVAADLLLSSRRMDGVEAHRIGLATHLVAEDELQQAAADYAARTAQGSPLSMALIKHQLVRDAEATAEEARRRAVVLLAHAKAQPDYAEGVSALREKRAARFLPLAPFFAPPNLP